MEESSCRANPQEEQPAPTKIAIIQHHKATDGENYSLQILYI
jgi:hypothetical protein